MHLGARLTINVIPQEVNLGKLKCELSNKGLFVTDGEGYSLNMSEFRGSRDSY